jgi:restriction system protein
MREVIDQISSEFKLTDQEKQELLPSGQQPIIDNRIGWARTYLLKAGLLESPKRGHVKITQNGLDVLKKNPPKINIKFLEQFPEFMEFRAIKKEQSLDKGSALIETEKEVENTPDELMEKGFNSIQADLAQKLLDLIRKNSPSFFEKVVLTLLENMGYGTGKVTGKSGDGGLDGYIYQDKLGLDKIIFQAKNFAEDTPVTASMIRDFIGTLATNDANKGVFITTTSRFPRDAENLAVRSPKPVKLIDGIRLVNLMIDFNIGVSTEKTYNIKRIDSDFFAEE